jgi:monovalent cation/hydrogen antiporter
MHTAELILQLLLAVALSGLLVRLLRVPAPFVQIALGAILTLPVIAGLHVTLDPSLFLLLFVPPLLFLDRVNSPKREFRALWLPISALAFGLVFFTIAIMGPLLHWLIPALPLPVAYALAAILSPTDAVAVSSLVDRSRFPPRFMHILEGEALLNDASGLVVFRFAVAAAMLGESFSLGQTYGPFILVAAGGALAGVVTLVVIAQAQRFIAKLGDIPSEAQVLVVLLLPFGAYLLAEHFHASGILAAVTAGLLFRWSGMYRHTGLAASIQSNILWGSLAFVFNGLIFLLLGLQLPDIIRKVPVEITARHPLLEPIGVVIALTLSLIAVRLGWSVLNSWVRSRISRWRGTHYRFSGWMFSLALAFAGVRGAITLAGVLSLPLALPSGAPFPGRDLAIFLAAGVILCSLLLASGMLPLIARAVEEPSESPLEAEERIARVAAARAAISGIETAASQGDPATESLRAEVAERIVQSYHRRIAATQEGSEDHAEAKAASEIERNLHLVAIAAERQAVRDLFQTRKINDETTNHLMGELALSEAMLRRSG